MPAWPDNFLVPSEEFDEVIVRTNSVFFGPVLLTVYSTRSNDQAPDVLHFELFYCRLQHVANRVSVSEAKLSLD